jgi:hypothetical protein
MKAWGNHEWFIFSHALPHTDQIPNHEVHVEVVAPGFRPASAALPIKSGQDPGGATVNFFPERNAGDWYACYPAIRNGNPGK